MFTPSQHDVRRFFCSVYTKLQAGEAITDAMEKLAAEWITQHPEYASDFADVQRALWAEYTPEKGGINPFLHLSMHLSISEQISVNQPLGVRDVFAQLAALHGEHAAQHHMMDALGEMLWKSQRDGRPPDAHLYLETLRRLL